MRTRSDLSSIVVALAALALSGCATARMHSEAELNTVGAQCGLAMGELMQDEEEKRLLFLFREAPSASERQCVLGWARRNKLRVVIIEAINDPVS